MIRTALGDLEEAREMLYSLRATFDPPSAEEIAAATSELLLEFIGLLKDCGFQVSSPEPHSHIVGLSGHTCEIEISLDRLGRIGFRTKGSAESPEFHEFGLDRHSGELSGPELMVAPICFLAERLRLHL